MQTNKNYQNSTNDISRYFKITANTPLLDDEQEPEFFALLAEYRQKFQECALSNPEINTQFRTAAQKIYKGGGNKKSFEETILRDFRYLRLLKKIADEKIDPNQKAELNSNYETYKSIRDYILKANTRLPVPIAKKFANSKNQFGEFLEVGNLGIAKAVDRFDLKEKVKFSTYATWWIRQIITREIKDNGKLIRIPAYVFGEIKKLKLFARDDFGFARTFDEMYDLASQQYALPDRELLRDALKQPISKDITSIDEICAEDGDKFEITDKKTKLPQEIVQQKQYSNTFKKVLNKLTKREAEVIRQRFGINGAKQKTQEEIGEKFDATGLPISQIEVSALRKLKIIIETEYPELLEEFGFKKPNHPTYQKEPDCNFTPELPKQEITKETLELHFKNANLSPTEEKIISQSMGFENQSPKTTQEISHEIKLLPSFVKRIETRARKKIEKIINKENKKIKKQNAKQKKITPHAYHKKKRLYDLCSTIMTSQSNCYCLATEFDLTERSIERLIKKLRKHEIKIDSTCTKSQSYYVINESMSDVMKKLKIGQQEYYPEHL